MAEPSVIYDVRGLLKDLDALQPGLRKQLVKEAKDIAKRPASLIKSQIPSTAPLSGMSKISNPNGRTAWGAGKPAKQVQIRFKSGYSRRSAITPLLSIWVTSPMTAIADIAGKGSMRKARKITSEYAYKDGSRRHAVTSQGRWMIRRLKERNLNNFVYPNVEDSLGDVQDEIKLIISRYAAKVNRKLN
ncbi:MAG: hypothetical protein EBS85_06220 [Micrococcales bacterium]|nr:hypothetical protein [Micrococcales bacterium]